MNQLQEFVAPPIKDDVTIFQGGLDLTTPDRKLKPGHLRNSQNWQVVPNENGGGYERIAGYSRFDGRRVIERTLTDRSLLVVQSWIFDLPNYIPTGTDVIGVVLKGATSGTTDLALLFMGGGAHPQVSNAVGSSSELYEGFPYFKTGHAEPLDGWIPGETIQFALFDIAGNQSGFVDGFVLDSVVSMFGSLSIQTQAKIIALETDADRPRIAEPPGSGPTLGVCSLVKDGVRTVYSWRANVDGSAVDIYKSTNVGWYPVALLTEVRFTAGGTTVPSEGSHVTKGAVSARILRVVLESGSWAAGTASGRLIIDSLSGGNFSAGSATIGAITLTLSGIQTVITLAPGGKYQFLVTNFGGQLSSKRIYGVDGVNRAFEFDGEILVPIETKAIVDTPSYIAEHHQHLVLAIGGSMMVSGPKVPYQYAVSAGGLEVTTGDTITGMLPQPGDQTTAAMAVYGRNSSGVLYGTGISDFNYKAFSKMTGALPFMQQNLDQSYVQDDRGVISFSASQNYGNFSQATLTSHLSKFLSDRKTLAVGSCVNRERSQFRLFFSDGSALYVTIVNGRLVGALPQQFYHSFTCFWNSEDENGNEETFAGSSTGMVYLLDRGASFDGQPITHYFMMNHNFMGMPSIKKQYHNGHLEITGDSYVEFSFGYNLNYGSQRTFQADPATVSSPRLSVPRWDSFIFDNFVWDGVSNGPLEVEIKGKSEAIQIVVSGSSYYVNPFQLSSLVTHYNVTRRTRGE